MAAIVLAAAATSAASSLGAGVFAAGLAGGVGGMLGGFIDSRLFATHTNQQGPRLTDLMVQVSTYGSIIPVVYGQTRIGGNVIWALPLQEHSTTTSVGGGGKGGGGSSSTQTTYTYSATLAVAICEGPLTKIERVWADAELVDLTNPANGTYTFYYGDESQLPDSYISTFYPTGQNPAYRGMAYVVIENFPLNDFGNRIPNFTFEVDRVMRLTGDLEDKIAGVAMIPGAGEYVYDTVVQTKTTGQPIVGEGDLQAETIHAVTALDNSYLFIQGPPGAGKTHTSAHTIIELMRQGKKIGVTANSHKAIHNLLKKVEEVAQQQKFHFTGIKKCSAGDETVYDGTFIHSESDAKGISMTAQLLAGTAWFFSEPRFEQHLDYLFVDEAGQVSVANIVAMGTSAKNIVLVGDQMQLGQPIQGVHPGEAGVSILEFLLGDLATIPPDRGIFLDNTRRLRPSICKFISDAFYDGRLEADPDNVHRKLIFDAGMADMPNEGIRMIPVEHTGCSQKSVEEGVIIKSHYQQLIGQQFQDKDGSIRRLTADDILVVTPYNVQVNYLKSILPDAKVGTVDKFQGQEAPIVLVSMVTSSAEDLPRNIEFLYSKNRLNVALSRAQCLAVVVANPKLLEIPCGTIEQMKLVNTFCWLNDYASKAKTGGAA